MEIFVAHSKYPTKHVCQIPCVGKIQFLVITKRVVLLPIEKGKAVPLQAWSGPEG